MNWKNILQNKCPKCGYGLIKAIDLYSCPGPECDFLITERKINELKIKMELDTLEQEREGWER